MTGHTLHCDQVTETERGREGRGEGWTDRWREGRTDREMEGRTDIQREGETNGRLHADKS